MENDDYSSEAQIIPVEKTKRSVPNQLLACAKLPRSHKMAIFAERRRKILEFLLDEHYSGINNLANVIDASRQTVTRIMKNLCDEDYVVKSDVGLGFTKKILVYQITHTGAMFITDAYIPTLPDISKISDDAILRELQLQEARISLGKCGYTQFKNTKQLLQMQHPLCKEGYKLPKYLCLDCDGNHVAVEYEDIIQSSEMYQQILDQYARAKHDKVIDKVLFFTRAGFADKLKRLLLSIGTSMATDNTAADIAIYFFCLEL